jgi:AcrR family transcriptional regulator
MTENMPTDVNISSRTDRKKTQRERLIAGMIAAGARHGYADATVSHVIAHAGVSRPTFYEYFRDKDECFLAAHRELSGLLIEEVRRAVAQVAPEQAVYAAIRAFIRLSEEFPDRACFLTNETMAAGWRGLDRHDRLIEDMAQVVEQAAARVPAQTPCPDLPIQLAFGAGRWLLAPPLRRGERDLKNLGDELIRWLESYETPQGEHRWSTLEPGPALPPTRHVAQMPLSPPPPIPPGRSKLSNGEIARNQRERIMYATAEVAVSKGYGVTTVADIVAAAGVDRRVFYKHFQDKQQAFLAVHEFCVQQLMAVTAGAFFSVSDWPERAWEAMQAATQFQATHSVIAHIALVESHAVGPSAIQRIDDIRTAFTIFFQEGNQHTDDPSSPMAMEAILAAIFEICYRRAREGKSELISRMACNGAYMMMAPFLGPAATNDFIEAKLRSLAAGSRQTSPPPR